MYAHRQANWLRRLMRLSGAVPPISWLYARTLHHLDRAVYRKRAAHRQIPVLELAPAD
jgi:hypothetical protein